MRFNQGELIGFGINLEADEPVYVVRLCNNNSVFATGLHDGIERHFDLDDQIANSGCLYNYGTFKENHEKLTK